MKFNKLILIAVAFVLAATISSNAQVKEKYYSESFWNNIYVTIGGGAQACVNPDNFSYGFGKAITPVITLAVGKNFTPVWGTRLQLNGAWTTLYTKYTQGGDEFFESNKNKKYLTLHADAVFNLSQAIRYREDRLVNFAIFMGPGLTFAKNYMGSRVYDNNGAAVPQKSSIKALINGSLGVDMMFNVSRFVDINLQVRGEVSPSPFGHLSNANTEGAVSAALGISYYFGGKKFVTTKCDDSDLKAALADLAKAKEELAKKPKEVEVIKEVEKIVNKEVIVAAPTAVFFHIGSAKLTDYAKVQIKLAAQAIKSNPDKKYKINAYADKATGSAKTNQRLTDKRAKAVYDALVEEGVNPDQLQQISNGGTENMFGKNYLQRLVIMEVE